METRRLISIIIAVAAAFLVMWAGKSCAEDIVNTNKKSDDYQGTFAEGYTPSGGYENYADYGDGTQPIPQQTETTATSNQNVQTVTNLLGEVVGTVTVTTTTVQTVETKPVTTASKSILESYNEQNPIGGSGGGNILDHSQPTETTAVTVQGVDPNDIVLNVG